MRSLTVLSLFSGIGIARLALDHVGISIGRYYSSEIDRYAIMIEDHHYGSRTHKLGDIKNYRTWNLPKIDLIVGGSPCQGFSYSGKGLNFNDPRSALYFRFTECIRQFKPTYFLLENVVMKQEWRDVITQGLESFYPGDVYLSTINSDLVSAQSRPRNYWTNFPVTIPDDRNVCIHSIIGKDKYPAAMRGRRIRDTYPVRQDNNRSIPIRQFIEPRSNNKSNCVTTVAKDNVIIDVKLPGRVLASDIKYEYYTMEQTEQLQTIPVGWTKVHGVSESQRQKLLGNAFTTDVLSHIFSFIK